MRAYLSRMSLTRLVRFLTLVAMLFAPLSMSGAHAALPVSGAAAVSDHVEAPPPAGHCADMDETQDRSGQSNRSIDCMIACAALPAADFAVASHPAAPNTIDPAPLLSGLSGLHPGSDPPPPRLS